MAQVSEKAPHFTLIDSARKQVSLSDFAGKTVVLVFIPAAFTGVCTKELCSFRDSIAAFNDVGATVLAIDVDAMTADVTEFSIAELLPIAARLVNEVKGINRVVYDLTTKPPGTIEWE